MNALSYHGGGSLQWLGALLGRAFDIFAAKKNYISCNICTAVCHQGIDIMNFANKDLLMADLECVRCNARVEACPTGVLDLGRPTLRAVTYCN